LNGASIRKLAASEWRQLSLNPRYKTKNYTLYINRVWLKKLRDHVDNYIAQKCD